MHYISYNIYYIITQYINIFFFVAAKMPRFIVNTDGKRQGLRVFIFAAPFTKYASVYPRGRKMRERITYRILEIRCRKHCLILSNSRRNPLSHTNIRLQGKWYPPNEKGFDIVRMYVSFALQKQIQHVHCRERRKREWRNCWDLTSRILPKNDVLQRSLRERHSSHKHDKCLH